MPSTWSFSNSDQVHCVSQRDSRSSPDQSRSVAIGYLSVTITAHQLARCAGVVMSAREELLAIDLDKTTKAAMVAPCRQLGLPISGLRAQVEARLRSYRARLQAAEDAESQTQSPPPTPGASLAGPAGSGHPPPHVGLAPTAAALAQLTGVAGPSSAAQSAPAAGTPGRSLSQAHLSAIAHRLPSLGPSTAPSRPLTHLCPLPYTLSVPSTPPPTLRLPGRALQPSQCPPPQLISYYQPPAASTGAVSSLHSQLTALQPAVSAGALTAGAFTGLQPQFTAQQPTFTVGVTHCPHTHFAPPHPAALAGAVSATPGWQPQVTAPQPAVTAGAAHSLPQLFTIQPAITAVSPSVLLSTQQSQLAIPGSHTFHLAPLNTSIPPLPTRFAAAAAAGEFVDFNELLYYIELGSREEPPVRVQLGEDQQLALSRKPKKRPVGAD